MPFPSPGNFLTQESNPGLPHCRQSLNHLSHQVSVYGRYLNVVFVQSQSCVRLLRPHERQHMSLPCPSVSQSLLKLMSIESMMPSSHLILCHPLLLLPSIFPNIGIVYNELALRIRWPKYWRFSFSISPSSEYSGLISFRMDWFSSPTRDQTHTPGMEVPSLNH